MSNNGENGTKTDVKIHVIYICIIFLLLSIIIGIVFTTDAIEKGVLNNMVNHIMDNSMTIAVSIVCSILASVIYTYIIKNDSESERKNLKKDIKEVLGVVYNEKIEDGIQRISKNISEIYSTTMDMLPSRYYRSADEPNLEFNTFINQKICKSKKFVYYGESARFTCKRLFKLKDDVAGLKNLKLEIYIVNPSCDKVFESNKAFLMAKEKNKNYGKEREWETIVNEEKIKVLYCLYALRVIMRFIQSVDIYLIDDIPFIDIEIADDMIALEFFRTRDDYKRYPLTIIYDNKKAFYESYEFYLEWEKEKANHIKDLTVDYILELGEKSGIKNLTEKKLEDYCEKEIFNDSEKYI